MFYGDMHLYLILYPAILGGLWAGQGRQTQVSSDRHRGYGLTPWVPLFLLCALPLFSHSPYMEIEPDASLVYNNCMWD